MAAEIRTGQQVTAEWINSPGEASTPLDGDWIFVVRYSQTTGRYLALGCQDIINSLFAGKGVKILYGRNDSGTVKTKVTLTDNDIVIENPSSEISLTDSEIELKNNLGAQVNLKEINVELNQGIGFAIELGRLQIALTTFSQLVVSEFGRVAAGTLPNPVDPYKPSPALPVNIASAKSETVKLP